MNKRPPLTKSIAIKDFQQFYWLKKELVAFCRTEQLSTSGSKIEISNRIVTYLQTGEKTNPTKAAKKQSTFDWKKETLSLNTVITDNYKNSENVRSFFASQIGKGFKFNVKFMSWMKANQGKTLQDAIKAWQAIKTQSKNAPKDIAPQFEYNRYIRDFLADNPKTKRSTAIACWKIKRALRGTNAYEKKDLKLLDKEG